MSDPTSVLQGLTAQNLFNLRGVVAVVTGGASGIGLMISSTLMANGVKVYIIDINQERMEKITKAYNENAGPQMGSLHGIQGDISKKSEAARLAAHISSLEPNGITVLFNNAGIFSGNFQRPGLSNPNPTAQDFVKALFEDVPEESFTDVYKVNAVGPYWMTFAFLPLLEKWKLTGNQGLQVNGGRGFVPQVIMTSSMNGWTKDVATSSFSFPYTFSKSAIGLGTAVLAHELLPLGIRVNGMAPGLFPSDMTVPGATNSIGITNAAPELKPAFEIPSGASASGGSRFDMGALVLSLVSNWNINGETVLIDGGTLLCMPSSY